MLAGEGGAVGQTRGTASAGRPLEENKVLMGLGSGWRSSEVLMKLRLR
jgi:hypothetical protein